MNKNIKNMVLNCNTCQKLRPAQPNLPMTTTPTKNLMPMQSIGTDLFSLEGTDYLIMVDRYSGFICSEKLNKTNTTAIINQLTKWFNLLGWPDTIRSDGGPQFRTEFDSFCKEKNIAHELTSPYNPQANGLAESAVKNAKYLLVKCKEEKQDYQNALASFRNMPRADGFSPAEMLFGHKQKINLPLPDRQASKLTPVQRIQAEHARDNINQQAAFNFNKTAKQLSTLSPGQKVLIKNAKETRWDSEGVIQSIREDGMSYNILHESGAELIRGRRLIKPKPIPVISNYQTRAKTKFHTPASTPIQQQPNFTRRSAYKTPEDEESSISSSEDLVHSTAPPTTAPAAPSTPPNTSQTSTRRKLQFSPEVHESSEEEEYQEAQAHHPAPQQHQPRRPQEPPDKPKSSWIPFFN